jgi:aspartate carbamoyltransferase catalytic subunit
MSKLSQRHLLGIKNITAKDIELIFETADNFKEVINRPIKKVPSLRDVTIANIFFENSTRTRLSFELAEKRLSADVVNFSASNSSVKKGETLLDTVNNILAMKVDMVVMRHASVGAHPIFYPTILRLTLLMRAMEPTNILPRHCTGYVFDS